MSPLHDHGLDGSNSGEALLLISQIVFVIESPLHRKMMMRRMDPVNTKEVLERLNIRITLNNSAMRMEQQRHPIRMGYKNNAQKKQ